VSFNETPTGGQLRAMLPDVAAAMEEDFVIDQLIKMALEFDPQRVNGDLVIELPLFPSHLMEIRAVDIGPCGTKEFITFVNVPKMQFGRRVKESTIKETIRAHVKITSLDKNDPFEPFSYTLHEENMRNLVSAAIEGVYQTRNVRLKPMKKKRPKYFGRREKGHG
jgi:hypothetical protein